MLTRTNLVCQRMRSGQRSETSRGKKSEESEESTNRRSFSRITELAVLVQCSSGRIYFFLDIGGKFVEANARRRMARGSVRFSSSLRMAPNEGSSFPRVIRLPHIPPVKRSCPLRRMAPVTERGFPAVWTALNRRLVLLELWSCSVQRPRNGRV